MSCYLIIENGVVVNAFEAEQAFASSVGAILALDGVGMGWTTADNINFVAPVEIQTTPVINPITALQQQVSDLQSQVAAIQALPAIAAAIPVKISS